MFVYCLLGMELFGHKIKYTADWTYDLENGTAPRINFDSFWHGMITIFITLTGDSWNFIMYDHVRFNEPVGVIYFLTLVIIGRFMLLNLFLAILL